MCNVTLWKNVNRTNHGMCLFRAMFSVSHQAQSRACRAILPNENAYVDKNDEVVGRILPMQTVFFSSCAVLVWILWFFGIYCIFWAAHLTTEQTLCKHLIVFWLIVIARLQQFDTRGMKTPSTSEKTSVSRATIYLSFQDFAQLVATL